MGSLEQVSFEYPQPEKKVHDKDPEKKDMEDFLRSEKVELKEVETVLGDQISPQTKELLIKRKNERLFDGEMANVEDTKEAAKKTALEKAKKAEEKLKQKIEQSKGSLDALSPSSQDDHTGDLSKPDTELKRKNSIPTHVEQRRENINIENSILPDTAQAIVKIKIHLANLSGSELGQTLLQDPNFIKSLVSTSSDLRQNAVNQLLATSGAEYEAKYITKYNPTTKKYEEEDHGGDYQRKIYAVDTIRNMVGVSGKQRDLYKIEIGSFLREHYCKALSSHKRISSTKEETPEVSALHSLGIKPKYQEEMLRRLNTIKRKDPNVGFIITIPKVFKNNSNAIPNIMTLLSKGEIIEDNEITFSAKTVQKTQSNIKVQYSDDTEIDSSIQIHAVTKGQVINMSDAFFL